MATPTRSFDADVMPFPDLTRDVRPPCECSHGDRPESRCGETATFRVTVECAAEGCDRAAGVYLICATCLSAWKRHAREDGVRLRVRPL